MRKTTKQPLVKEPQLIVAADEPALFYSSISRAEADLETIDVENGVYTAAFGPRGERYRIENGDNSVLISLDESKPADPQALRELVLRFLNAVEVPVKQGESLAELLRKCAPFIE
jgi:hypothetical protein